MSRYSRYETYNDGNDVYDNRHDAGEFSTYGRSRGPSSGTFSDNRSSASRQSRQDAYGYPMQGGYAGEPDLRRRIARNGESSSSSHDDPRARLGSSAGAYGFQASRRSGLREQAYADEWQQRQEQRAQLEVIQREQEREQERRRAARDGYHAFVQGSRGQQQCGQEERPRNVLRYGPGYFPAYEWR